MSDSSSSASSVPSGLPAPDSVSAAHGDRVSQHLRELVLSAPGRRLPFDVWMDEALYAPGLGYYAAGSTKLGTDFTTAPELTPVFGYTLSNQVADILQACTHAQPAILEFGAGSGAMAEAVLNGLKQQGLQPQYLIVEVSPDLQHRQQQRLQAFGDQVQWLNQLPNAFEGCVLANEVLDAMPVRLFRFSPSAQKPSTDASPQLLECMVGLSDDSDDGHFAWQTQVADKCLQQAVSDRMPPLPGYQSEINLRAEAWVRGMGQWLKQGAALLIDYGFPQREYYHPQRCQGTLMCHFRHHSHAQPLIYPGLQDITAHVDFTAMADAALAGGMDVLGYTSQAHFLINAGLMDVLQQTGAAHGDLSAVQTLMSEAEMGELFKVLAVGANLDISFPLRGFSRNDRRHRL